MELLDYEKKHLTFLEENSHECTLFLKRNEAFPLLKPCKVVLVGNGARNTIKGGTGSGDVLSRFMKSCEEGLEARGFTITSKKWLDEYDEYSKSTVNDYIKDVKKNAKKNHILPVVYSMGYFYEEKNYDISCDYDGDACIYVLSRNSGEGNDRRCIKGDVKLSLKEVADILFLNKKFKKFLLVLNVGGVVDLTEVLEVNNILYLSQLGAVTGDVFAKIVLGEVNPSGKLSTTWAKPEDYPGFTSFGDLHDTYYNEGIYVGYRYFNTVGKKPYFEFGYGLSYTDFKIEIKEVSLTNLNLKISTSVTNIGKFSGKEVVQIYVSKPTEVLDNPYVELTKYQKTPTLKPKESIDLTFTVDISKATSYDERRCSNVLLKGEYIYHIGNSSLNLTPVCKCVLNEDVITEKLENKLVENVETIKIERANKIDVKNLKAFVIDASLIKTRAITYKKDIYVDPTIEKLSNEELALLTIGHHDKGLFAAIVGSSAVHAIGGAGETSLRVKSIQKSLSMADGPAGLRLKAEYGIDKKGMYDISIDPIMEKMIKFLPKAAGLFMTPPKNRHGKVYHQYTTAIPIGTALAQSFNDEFVMNCGKLVSEEMKMFNVDLWLAPALNIHRNILCGRNFEYYSEDPYLSGKIASAMVLGVENTGNGHGTTIKHFACNNQELNRNNNNSHLSERTLREIYLKGFEICIKEANPKAIMTSYNLINGTHTSESYELINDILRNEWNYDGLVMTDWIKSGRNFCSTCKYPAPYASKNILAGNDLTMSGTVKDYKDVMKALKKGIITREDLVHSASRIYRSILKQKQ